MSEEIPDSPEYGFGGAAYARARKLKQKEMQAQAWHDANVAPIGTIFPVDKDDEIARLRQRIATLEAALAGLVNRLDEIHADPAYKSVWAINQFHVGPYKGPTYVEALARARAALKDASRTRPNEPFATKS